MNPLVNNQVGKTSYSETSPISAFLMNEASTPDKNYSDFDPVFSFLIDFIFVL